MARSRSSDPQPRNGGPPRGLVACIEEAARLAALAELPEAEVLERRLPAWRRASLRIAVAGAFNTGKSTLLGLLIRRPDLLPVAVTPTTARPVEIAAARDLVERAFRVEPSGKVAELPFDAGQLRELIRGASPAPGLIRLQLKPDGPALDADSVLVDTPGVSSAVEGHSVLAEASIREADVVIFVLDAEKILSQEDLRLLVETLPPPDRCVFVINRIDALSSSQVVEVVEFVREALADRLELAPPASRRLPQLIAMSASGARKHAPWGPTANAEAFATSGFAAFERAIQGAVLARRLELTCRSMVGAGEQAIAALDRALTPIRDDLSVKSAARDACRDELKLAVAAIASAKRQLRAARANLEREWRHLWREEWAILRDDLLQIDEGIEEWVDERDADDIEDSAGERIGRWIAAAARRSRKRIIRQAGGLRGPLADELRSWVAADGAGAALRSLRFDGRQVDDIDGDRVERLAEWSPRGKGWRHFLLSNADYFVPQLSRRLRQAGGRVLLGLGQRALADARGVLASSLKATAASWLEVLERREARARQRWRDATRALSKQRALLRSQMDLHGRLRRRLGRFRRAADATRSPAVRTPGRRPRTRRIRRAR